jgi:hypothetical protein
MTMVCACSFLFFIFIFQDNGEPIIEEPPDDAIATDVKTPLIVELFENGSPVRMTRELFVFVQLIYLLFILGSRSKSIATNAAAASPSPLQIVSNENNNQQNVKNSPSPQKKLQKNVNKSPPQQQQQHAETTTNNNNISNACTIGSPLLSSTLVRDVDECTKRLNLKQQNQSNKNVAVVGKLKSSSSSSSLNAIKVCVCVVRNILYYQFIYLGCIHTS